MTQKQDVNFYALWAHGYEYILVFRENKLTGMFCIYAEKSQDFGRIYLQMTLTEVMTIVEKANFTEPGVCHCGATDVEHSHSDACYFELQFEQITLERACFKALHANRLEVGQSLFTLIWRAKA